MSRCDIQRFGACQDLLANPGVQELRRHHVNASALQESGELALDTDEIEAGNVVGLEFNQYVDITIRAKIIAQDRAKQSQPPDVMFSAERGYGVVVDRDMWTHRCSCLLYTSPSPRD